MSTLSNIALLGAVLAWALTFVIRVTDNYVDDCIGLESPASMLQDAAFVAAPLVGLAALVLGFYALGPGPGRSRLRARLAVIGSLAAAPYYAWTVLGEVVDLCIGG